MKKKTKNGGTKHDTGKPDLAIVPYSFTEQVALALMAGEKKYSRYNYRQGFTDIRLLAAAKRHIDKYLWLADTDPEFGLSHLAHAAACLAMAIDLKSIGKLEDKRAAEVVREAPKK